MILKGPLSLARSDTYIDALSKHAYLMKMKQKYFNVYQQFRWVIGQTTGGFESWRKEITESFDKRR